MDSPARLSAMLIDSTEARVAEFIMKPYSKGSRHYHSSVTEHCLCLEGCLLVERDAAPPLLLRSGQRIEIAAGVAHKVSNPEGISCRYMVVQGTGPYDFVNA